MKKLICISSIVSIALCCFFVSQHNNAIFISDVESLTDDYDGGDNGNPYVVEKFQGTLCSYISEIAQSKSYSLSLGFHIGSAGDYGAEVQGAIEHGVIVSWTPMVCCLSKNDPKYLCDFSMEDTREKCSLYLTDYYRQEVVNSLFN